MYLQEGRSPYGSQRTLPPVGSSFPGALPPRGVSLVHLQLGVGGCPWYSSIAGRILIAPPVPGGGRQHPAPKKGSPGGVLIAPQHARRGGTPSTLPPGGGGVPYHTRGGLPVPCHLRGGGRSLLHPPSAGRGSLAHSVCAPPAPCRTCHVVPVHPPPPPPPKTDLCGVCRLLGGQHGVGAVLAGKVADDADGAAILHAVEPQRFAVTGATRRPRRAGRSGGGQRRGGGGRPRRRFSGARRQPQLANDVDDITERTIRTEKPLRHRLPALRAAEPPRRVLPALGHAGAAEVMTALGHQHRVVKVLQAHRTRQFVLQATGSAAGSRRYGGGSGWRLHPGSPA